MGLFYKASDKELLDTRNKLFITYGFPPLEKNGFTQAPFSTDNFGRNNLKDFTYEFGRLGQNSTLELITVHISRGDKWIKIFLNIFEPVPKLEDIDKLKESEATQFRIPPNSITLMRLRLDDLKGMPLFRTKEHKLGRYFSKHGLESRVEKLGKLINTDLANINHFIRRWHEMHKPLRTTWEGHPVQD